MGRKRQDLVVGVVGLDEWEAVDHLLKMLWRLCLEQDDPAAGFSVQRPHLTGASSRVKDSHLRLFLKFRLCEVRRYAISLKLLVGREDNKILHMSPLFSLFGCETYAQSAYQRGISTVPFLNLVHSVLK